jgi:hypothetical protein
MIRLFIFSPLLGRQKKYVTAGSACYVGSASVVVLFTCDDTGRRLNSRSSARWALA